MIHAPTLLLSIAISVIIPLSVANAGEPGDETVQTRQVIALKTDDFELAETDISELAVGERETIVTESGTAIDLVRTAEGVEVYVDGELLDIGADDDSETVSAGHRISKRVEVKCTDDGECEKMVWVTDGEDTDLDMHHAANGDHKIIRKRIEIHCENENDCQEHESIMIHGDDGEITGSGDTDHHEKVIIIEKKSGKDG